VVGRRTGAGLLLAVLAFLGGCGPSKTQGTPAAAEAAPEVEVYLVAPADKAGARVHTALSTLAVEREADLLAEEEGNLTEVLADQGQRVSKGQVLARQDDSRVRKELEQDRAEMQRLEAHSREAQVLREAAEVELQRQTELHNEGLGSRRDYDRARFNLEAMRHEVEKARLDYERAKARVEGGELRISRMQFRAPFDGIVARRYARTGQFLLRNEKVLRVTELRPLVVRFTVPERLRGAAETGAAVEVVTEGAAGTVRARVVRTSYVVDAASGSVECVAQLVEPVPAALVPGMSVEVRVAAGGVPAALWVPASAVRRGADGMGEVFAVSGDRLARRVVKLGRETPGGVQVLSGVAPGDRIVARVTDNLQDGMTVRAR
jgi:RND family efflux transporter MFP subunit